MLNMPKFFWKKFKLIKKIQIYIFLIFKNSEI